MKRVVTYLMSGVSYCHYLVPSLYTLRKHWDGPIEVYSFPESADLIETIAKDARLGIKPVRWNVSYRKRNAQFLAKIILCKIADCDQRLYLDADTTIHGDLKPLFERAFTGFCCTRFNRWNSNGGHARGRVERLRQFKEHIPEWAIDEVTKNPHPSPNGGVFVASPESPVLDTWHDMAFVAKSIFICDEAVLHLLPVIYPKLVTVETSGRYNCSHKWRDQVDNPIIYHYHGNSCCRPEKNSGAVEEWWPIYHECFENNIGGLADWGNSVRNRWMDGLLQNPMYHHVTTSLFCRG